MRTDPFLFAQHLRPLYGPNPESLMRTVTVDFSGAASGSLPFFCFVAVVVLGVGITLGHYLGYYVPPTPTPFVRDFTEKDIDVIFALMLKEERFEEMLAEYAGTEAGLRIQAKEQQAILLEWEQLPFDWDPIFIEIIWVFFVVYFFFLLCYIFTVAYYFCCSAFAFIRSVLVSKL